MEGLPESALGNSVQTLTDEALDMSKIDMAIVGLTENRGTKVNFGASDGADQIRKKFYALKRVAITTASLTWAICKMVNLMKIVWPD